ncbi:MAG: hypothetical protein II633_05870, partial [Bacteroidales bacterium]|nr:hypothetical protein [Bacteroidales bacterium]
MKSSSFLRRATMLLCFVSIGFAFNSRAQDYGDEPDKTLSPYFVVVSENPDQDNLPLKETSVNANIVG